MSPPLDAAELLNNEFLEIRARLLQVAAALDRLDRATGDVSRDKRRADLDQAIRVLLEAGTGRAEKLQRVFSLAYDQDWKKTFGLANGRPAGAE
ncbi:MAG TPA: hypothetical protein VJ809_00535 [Pirellulales bacterium]|jgi:hypothetical protein|nr:hypothetical protein [Pirellulales bacterium]